MKKFKAGDKVKCIDLGNHQFLITPHNRLVLGKIYTVRYYDDVLGSVFLKNKRVSWMASKFVKVKPYRVGGKWLFETLKQAIAFEKKKRAKDGIFRGVEKIH